MHDLIDPQPVTCKALKERRSSKNTNHPLNLCKTSWDEKDIANVTPVNLFSRQTTYCTALSFQVNEGSKGIICHGGGKLPAISKPHLSASVGKTEINTADLKEGKKII